MSTALAEDLHQKGRPGLTDDHLRIARSLAWRYYQGLHLVLPPGVDLEDLVSMAYLGVAEALDRYDPAGGVALNVYVGSMARNYIRNELRTVNPLTRHQQRWAKEGTFQYPVFVPLDCCRGAIETGPYVGDDGGPGGLVGWLIDKADLTQNQRQVVEMFLEGLGPREMSKRLGISHQACSQRLAAAVSRLREAA